MRGPHLAGPGARCGSDCGDHRAGLLDGASGSVSDLLGNGLVWLGAATGSQPQSRKLWHGEGLAGGEDGCGCFVGCCAFTGVLAGAGLGVGGVVGVNGGGIPADSLHGCLFGGGEADAGRRGFAGLLALLLCCGRGLQGCG